jgi:hypothetical protein
MKRIVIAVALLTAAAWGCTTRPASAPVSSNSASAAIHLEHAAAAHKAQHHRFVPLYRCVPTEWLGWLADGRPEESGS